MFSCKFSCEISESTIFYRTPPVAVSILIGDFNAEISNSHVDPFCAIYHLKSLIKEPTCCKNPDTPAYIDLIIISPTQFQVTLALETGLSDFHKMTVAAFKSQFPHQKPKMISYRNYKHFNRDNFEKEIKKTLIIQKISTKDSLAFKKLFLKLSTCMLL